MMRWAVTERNCLTIPPRPPAGPLIRKFLLANGHRVTVELRPDPALGDAIEATEQQRLQGVRGVMGDSDLEAVVASTQVGVLRCAVLLTGWLHLLCLLWLVLP